MDFNDIKLRLSRTLSAIDEQFDGDILANSVVTKTHRTFNYKFGNKTPDQLSNRIFTVLHDLATLKDHSVNALNKKRVPGSKNIVESLINSSLEMQVLMDLVNQDKHGYPLMKYKRSKLDPIIKDISQGLIMEDPYTRKKNPAPLPFDESGNIDVTKLFANATTMEFDFKGNIVGGKGEHKITITANVYSGKGVHLFPVNKMIEVCYHNFERLIQSHELV